MSAVSEAALALEAALKTVARVYTDPAANVDPPGLVLAPPSLTWEGYGYNRSDPSDATFVVAVVVANNARAMGRLWELVPQVAAAIEAVDDAVVRRAEPGTWTSSDLPAYLIEIEVAL